MPGIPNLVPQKQAAGIPNWDFSKIFQQKKGKTKLKLSEKLFIYTHKNQQEMIKM